MSAPKQGENPQEQDCTNNSGHQTADNARCGDSEQTKHPSAQHSADNAYYQIEQQPEATTSHEFAGSKSGNNPNDNVPNEKHKFLNFN